MTDILKAEDLLQLNIFLYDFDFMDRELIGELCRRSIQKFEKSVKLLRYNNHICYDNSLNSLFKAFRCTTCDTFFSKMGNLERHLFTCSDRVKHFYPKKVHELRETFFEKLDASNISHRNEQKLQEFGNVWLWVHLGYGRRIQANWKYNADREACAHISFYLAKLDPGTHFSLQRQSSSFHLVFSYCSRRISNSKQISDEIEFYWSRDCDQDKTVFYTGATQIKTQASREDVENCRWLCRGGGRGVVYTIPANAKKIPWLTGTLWVLLCIQFLDSPAQKTIIMWSSRICYQLL